MNITTTWCGIVCLKHVKILGKVDALWVALSPFIFSDPRSYDQNQNCSNATLTWHCYLSLEGHSAKCFGLYLVLIDDNDCWLHGSLSDNWGLNNWLLEERGLWSWESNDSIKAVTQHHYSSELWHQAELARGEVPVQTHIAACECSDRCFRNTRSKNILCFYFSFSPCVFLRSPRGGVHHQRWSDAPCRRQVGQTPWCHGPHDGVHMPG